MKNQGKSRKSLFVIIAAIIGVAVALIAATRWYLIPYPDSDHVVVTQISPDGHRVTVFDKHDTANAETILNKLTSRVNVTGKEFHCDAQASPSTNPYYHYSVTLSHWGLTTATATGDSTGCTVTIAYLGGATETYYAISPDSQPSIWDDLHTILGAPTDQNT